VVKPEKINEETKICWVRILAREKDKKDIVTMDRRARYLTGESLEVVLAEFSTLS
jgi:hypothetical protein